MAKHARFLVSNWWSKASLDVSLHAGCAAALCVRSLDTALSFIGISWSVHWSSNKGDQIFHRDLAPLNVACRHSRSSWPSEDTTLFSHKESRAHLTPVDRQDDSFVIRRYTQSSASLFGRFQNSIVPWRCTKRVPLTLGPGIVPNEWQSPRKKPVMKSVAICNKADLSKCNNTAILTWYPRLVTGKR